MVNPRLVVLLIALSSFVAPVAVLAADESDAEASSANYCALRLAEDVRPATPDDVSAMQAHQERMIELEREFVADHLAGRPLTADLKARADEAVRAAIEFENRFGWDQVLSLGLAEQYGRLAQIVNRGGKVPTLDELRELEAEILRTGPVLLELKAKRESLDGGYNAWHRSIAALQQTLVLFKMIHPDDGYEPDWAAIFDLLKKVRE